jgi:hypothetical protein
MRFSTAAVVAPVDSPRSSSGQCHTGLNSEVAKCTCCQQLVSKLGSFAFLAASSRRVGALVSQCCHIEGRFASLASSWFT